MQATNQTPGISIARRRSLILASLIVVVTLFWVLLLYFTNLPTLALAGIGLLSILTLSVGTAWTALAIPRSAGQESRS